MTRAAFTAGHGVKVVFEVAGRMQVASRRYVSLRTGEIITERVSASWWVRFWLWRDYRNHLSSCFFRKVPA